VLKEDTNSLISLQLVNDPRKLKTASLKNTDVLQASSTDLTIVTRIAKMSVAVRCNICFLKIFSCISVMHNFAVE